jgi:sulfur carrier protein
MRVTVEVVGDAIREVELADEEPPTYADLLRAVDLSDHEASVLVDGRPVPGDAPVDDDVEAVRVLRLVKGG